MAMMVVWASFILAIGSALLFLLGLRAQRRAMVLEERLARFGHRPPSLDDLELQLPFRQRVLYPFFERLARLVVRFTPGASLERIQQRLVEAGLAGSMRPGTFIGIQVVLTLGLGVLGAFPFVSGSGPALYRVGLPFVMGALGWVLPRTWLSRRIAQRKRAIQRALPDAIDLLVISVEAGLGFDQALLRVVEKWDNELTKEFAQTLSEMRMGLPRRQALRDLARRVNVDELNVFIASLVQADQLGVSVSQVLRAQANQMRLRRRQRAQELAQKAPIKMIFPMVFLIFPALFVVILGPAVPRIIEAFR
ncbi:type II secretion system F family protein [Thermomicrobium sp. 4228-Ro]|uniref:type II secretion system F family protein n=1 Tax=Thermomicrobium sp. 4228-Ro TaxID=2993937 RepID=UPI002248789C|nr:type II secretion system F family protein [Thermomicrobium sp. 4228-Ro]MCX2727710.1 type II secretion system F family protein [Thermomicrobium sp. 4228-Ro]